MKALASNPNLRLFLVNDKVTVTFIGEATNGGNKQQLSGNLNSPTNPKITNMMGFRVFQIMKSESYKSQMKQNNSTEFVCYSFHNIYNKHGPQTHIDPKSDSFKVSEFQRFKVSKCFDIC